MQEVSLTQSGDVIEFHIADIGSRIISSLNGPRLGEWIPSVALLAQSTLWPFVGFLPIGCILKFYYLYTTTLWLKAQGLQRS